jgi:PAS domain S-box-containing protein
VNCDIVNICEKCFQILKLQLFTEIFERGGAMTNVRILVAEDEAIVAKNIETRLNRTGYVVSAVALSGEEAVQQASETRPDLVLMDIKLAGEMDGIEAAEQIRARFGIPVVYLTAYADKETLQRAKMTEPFGYVLKPFKAEELCSAIEVALHRHEMDKKVKESEARYRAVVEDQTELICRFRPDGMLTFVNEAYCRYFDKRREELIGYSFMPLIPEEDRGFVGEGIASLSSENPVATHEHRVVRPNGEIGWQQWTNRAIFDEGGCLVEFQAVGRDITDRVRAEQALLKRNRELTLLNRAGQAFSSTLDLDQVLVTVLEEVCGLLDVTACSVWLIDSDTGELVCRQATDPSSEVVRGWRLAPGEGIAGWVACRGESLIVPDAQADERHFEGMDQKTGLETRSLLSVPLRVKRDVIGVIQVIDTEIDRFGSTDLRLVEALASAAAIAIENARLYARNRRLAVERERHRLARELHDTVTQSLYSIGMAAQTLLKLLGQTQPHSSIVRDPVEHILRLSRAALTEMREQLHGLHPTALADKGLVEALAQHCDLLREQYALTIELLADSELAVSIGQREGLYNIAREALWNVVKHAGATHVDISLTTAGDHVELSIVDDGGGFDPTIYTRDEMVGLRTMEERTKLLGGSFELQSRPGRGTWVTVRIPVRSPEDDEVLSDQCVPAP